MCGFFFHTGFQIEKNPQKPSVLGFPRKSFNADDRT